MRDAILNIRKSDLIQVLERQGVVIDIDALFREAKKFKVSYNIDEKTFQKFAKVQDAGKFELFNNLLTSCLQEAHNPTARKILVQDSAFNIMKEVSILAEEFCRIYNFDTREGFIEYIRLGLKFMGKKYAINKFKYYNAKIVDLYGTQIEIKEDKNKKLTERLAEYYSFLAKISPSKEDTIHFVRCAAQIIEIGADPKHFMDVQFGRFEWSGNIPEPYNLYGEAAQIAYNKNPVKKKDGFTEKMAEALAEQAKQQAIEKRDKFLKD